MPNENGWAVVTGASSGLGAIFADQLAERGLSLILAGRDEVRLKAVAQRISQQVEVETVVGDLGTDDGFNGGRSTSWSTTPASAPTAGSRRSMPAASTVWSPSTSMRWCV
jgi:NAD(P)-dependent dehydrogenase (short-subunit alcohol dehydrogenase family)